MKKHLLYYCLLFVNLAFSQQILDKKETISRTVTDPRAIFLTNGFTASSNDVNQFIAKIDTNTTIAPNGGTTNSTAGTTSPSGEIAGTRSFHDTKGEINVDGGGQLNFSLPIALPPSINGVAPQTNLMYSSGSGVGIAGMGFSLSGISSISRIGKNIEKDGESKGVQLNYSDYYLFNGQRLLLKDASDPTKYGKDGTEYVTEKFSTVKIKSVGSISGESYQGPQYFEITFDNGAQAWYGTTNDSQTAMEYNLVKWKDAQGNYITYNYAKNNNVSIIANVQWGGNETAGTAHFNTIVFNYSARDYKEVSYIRGVKFLQDKILANVVVNTNGNQFKKYVVNYINDDNNTKYQYVGTIIEYNSQNQAANPVTFDYQKSANSNWDSKEFVDNNNNKILGDFDGDGTIDYLQYHDPYQACLNRNRIEGWCYEWITVPAGLTLFKSYLGNKIETQISFGTTTPFTKEDLNKAIAITFKKTNGEVSDRQGIFITKHFSTPQGHVEGQVYSIDDNNQLKLEYSKPLTSETTYRDSFIESGTRGTGNYDSYTVTTSLLEPIQLDLDGDGLSEIITRIKDHTTSESEVIDNATYKLSRMTARLPAGYQIITSTRDDYRYQILNFDSSVSVLDSFSDSPYYSKLFEKPLIGDFKGNGKISILNFQGGNSPTITSFKKDKLTQKFVEETISTSLIFNGLIENAVIGDFNGDKKTDLMIPVAMGNQVSISGMQVNYKTDALSGDWRLYLSTGDGFKEEYKSGLGKWYPSQILQLSNVTATRRINYKAIDLDKDGKSELVQFDYYTIKSQLSAGVYTETTINVLRNSGASSTNDVNFQSTYNYSFKNTGVIYDYGELVGDFLINQINNSILLLGTERDNNSKGLMYTFNLYDTSKTSRINTITQGNIPTAIEYKELNSKLNPDFYAVSKKEQYPYVELESVSQSFVVSQLKQLDRKQDFKYRGLLAHINGRGMIGFRKFARSNWYANGLESTKVWSANEIDPLQNGLVVKEWTTRQESDVFPSDVSINNSQLLSFKYFGYKPKETLANGVEVIVPEKSTEKDFIKNVTRESTITYDNYYLPSDVNNSVNNGFATTVNHTVYTHNPTGIGKDYFMGRVVQKTETATAYGNTKKAKTTYTFANNLPKTIRTYNQDESKNILDTYQYDSFGNLTEKTVTNSQDGQRQYVKNEYDPKGLYVLKSTNILGLVSQSTYNDWGQVLTQTDPLGNTVTNTYDGWGKQLTSKSNLAGTTTFTYKREGDDIVATQYDPIGDVKETRTNKLGQQYQAMTKGFEAGTYVYKKVEYDLVGRKIRESEPYYASDSPQWNNINYDDSVFPAKATVTSFNGKIVETQVIGNTTWVKELNGYNRNTRKTTDALGNVIESEDKGGIILFAYNAIGQNISATYGQNVVVTKYDTWGRKSEFNDPSNGLYKYEYDGLGKLTKEFSPKGKKEYTFNTLGQLINQTEISTDDGGKATNKNISFTYDNKGRITDKSGTANGKTYNSNITYDSSGRVVASAENSNDKFFYQKNLTYDDTGRVASYEKGLLSSGTVTKTSIQNVYDSWAGSLYQLQDKNTFKVLWQLQKTKANGQILKAKLGAVAIVNIYDSNNFLTSTSQASTVQPNVLNMSYSFNAVKNELNTRSRTGILTCNEIFQYDDNNRLISWTNPKTGQLSSNSYDEKGRILTNDQTGTSKFDSAKIYQLKSQTLNATGLQYYTNNNPLLISYNENNDPVYIDGQHGDALFSYGLTEMRQLVTYGGNFNPDLGQKGKFTKYYSEDGSYEITLDNTTGKEKHILYIGGSPYESDIVFVKNYTDTTAKYLFLHKDYIGSILAISDEDGNSLEQRHYDAWGNFVKYANAFGELAPPAVAGGLLLDRGYTSHEHFEEMGIIHMNGRLYDPMQRRFLNADENIQDPNNTQCYNKYGYTMNNPLMFNDPSGEIIPLLVAAILIGAAVGTASYLVAVTINIMNGGDARVSLSGVLKSAFWGAVSGAVTFGIGSAFTSAVTGATQLAKSLGTAAFLVKAAAHGIAQGLLSMVQNHGAGFLSGAAAGFFGDLGATAWGAGAGKFASSTVGTVAFGALSGGVGAELTGGNFWQGAVTGGIVAGLNASMHKISQRADITARLKAAGFNDPQAAADYAGLSLNEFAQKVFPDMMASAKNPHFKKVETIDKAGSLGLTPVGANDVTGVHTFRGPVLIAKAAFSSYMQLASTMGHELSHVIDCVSGSMTTWFKKGGENYRSAMTELRAYQWVGLNGGNFNAPMYLYNLNQVGNYYNKLKL